MFPYLALLLLYHEFPTDYSLVSDMMDTTRTLLYLRLHLMLNPLFTVVVQLINTSTLFLFINHHHLVINFHFVGLVASYINPAILKLGWAPIQRLSVEY